MRVRAIDKGFYGCIREPGSHEVFDIDPKHFSEKWMVRVEDETPIEPVPAVQEEEPLPPSGGGDLMGLKIAELRGLAEAAGIDHTGMSKAELREALA